MPLIEKKFLKGRLVKAVGMLLRYGTAVKIFNFLAVEAQRLLKREVLAGAPYFIKLQPTNICHADCAYCLRHEKNQGLALGKMSPEVYEGIVAKVKRHALLIGFQYNGEPLCHEGIYEMITRAHLSRIGTYVSTNLMEFKEGDCGRLVSSGLDLLTVSIDGISQETYHVHRKTGSIQVVLKNLRGIVAARQRLRSRTPFITLQFIVTRHNQHEIMALRALAAEIGVDELALKPVGTTDHALMADDHDLRRRVFSAARRNTCWWLWGAMLVRWDGSLVPCCHIAAKLAGVDLRKDGMATAVNHPDMQHIRKLAAQTGGTAEHPCRGCLIPYGSLLRQTL